MKCPHCLQGFHSKPNYISTKRPQEPTHDPFEQGSNDGWALSWEYCPGCPEPIVRLHHGYLLSGPLPAAGGTIFAGEPDVTILAHPKGVCRELAPEGVPDHVAQDYKEACLILNDSPQASAALSRRLLQTIIREEADVKPEKKNDLYYEIEALLESRQLPTHLAEDVGTIRIIGNFAAHPKKSKNTGEIVKVDWAEADWSLRVLMGLFDFYYVQPARSKADREALQAKAAETGGAKIQQPPEEPEDE